MINGAALVQRRTCLVVFETGLPGQKLTCSNIVWGGQVVVVGEIRQLLARYIAISEVLRYFVNRGQTLRLPELSLLQPNFQLEYERE